MTIPPAVRSRDQMLRECGPETAPAARKDTNTLVSQGKPDRPGRGQGRIALRSATGHSRNHRHTGSGRHRCIEPVGKAHILIAYIDIHEAAQISGIVNDSASQARIRRVQAGENLAQSTRIRGHLGRTSRESAQDGRDSDGDAHPWPAFLCYRLVPMTSVTWLVLMTSARVTPQRRIPRPRTLPAWAGSRPRPAPPPRPGSSGRRPS